MWRYRWPAFLAGALFFALWYAINLGKLQPPSGPDATRALLSGALFAWLIWLLTWFLPALAFVQPRPEGLYLRTPFYRLTIPYDLILSTRPVDLRKVFHLPTLRPTQRSLLAPLSGSPALAVDLERYPSHPLILRLFLSRYFLSPERPGLILAVRDWAQLSRHLTEAIDQWRLAHQVPEFRPASDAAAIIGPPRPPERKWWQFWKRGDG
jgi:hypothetical protein